MAAFLPFRAQLCREKPSLTAPPDIPSLHWSLLPTLTGLLPGKHRGHSHASRLPLLAAAVLGGEVLLTSFLPIVLRV